MTITIIYWLSRLPPVKSAREIIVKCFNQTFTSYKGVWQRWLKMTPQIDGVYIGPQDKPLPNTHHQSCASSSICISLLTRRFSFPSIMEENEAEEDLIEPFSWFWLYSASAVGVLYKHLCTYGNNLCPVYFSITWKFINAWWEESNNELMR